MTERPKIYPRYHPALHPARARALRLGRWSSYDGIRPETSRALVNDGFARAVESPFFEITPEGKAFLTDVLGETARDGEPK